MQPVIVTNEKKIMNQRSLFIKLFEKFKNLFKKHPKKKIAALMLLIVVIAALALGNQEKGITVNTGSVIKDTIEQTVFGTGKLEVKHKQAFYCESSTTVTEVFAEAGQKVTKGQVILRTDDSYLQIEASKNKLSLQDIEAKIVNSDSNLRLFEQEYNLAQKKHESSKILYEAGAVSKSELDDAMKALNQASEKLVVERDATLPLLKAQLAQARLIWQKSEEKLQKATVISPVNGVLLSLPATKDQRLEVGALLAEIGDPALLEIRTGINEIDAANLTVGDHVEIINSSLLTEPLMGVVEYIAPIAEVIRTAQGDQSQVQISIGVNDGQIRNELKPGYNINFKIILEHKDEAVLVPYEAVVKNDEKDVVYVISDEGFAEERKVQTGLGNELFMEILSGVDEGEKVVLNPSEQIKNGVKVKVDAASK